MRIAIARFSHETCTFCPKPTTSQDYEKGGVPHGEDVIKKARSVKGYVRGFVGGLLGELAHSGMLR
jgi:microcystin degradation protein MlrC